VHAEQIIMDANPLVSDAPPDETGATGDARSGMALTLRLNGPLVGARGCSGRQLLGVCISIFLLNAPLLGIDRDRRLDELYHTSWTTKDGAPSEIFAITQAGDGYLWLGTTDGTGELRRPSFREVARQKD
jgi:hypothetical protein